MKQNTRGLSLTAGILFLILGVYLIGAVILDIITLEIPAPYAQQYVLAAFLDYLGLLAIGIGLICRSRAVVLAGSLWQAVIYALSLVSWVNWAYWQEASPAGRAAVFASAYVQGGLRNLLLFLLMFFILITLILALCRAKALKSLWLLPLIPAALCLAWSAAGPFLVSLVLALPAATLTEILAALDSALDNVEAFSTEPRVLWCVKVDAGKFTERSECDVNPATAALRLWLNVEGIK